MTTINPFVKFIAEMSEMETIEGLNDSFHDAILDYTFQLDDGCDLSNRDVRDAVLILLNVANEMHSRCVLEGDELIFTLADGTPLFLHKLTIDGQDVYDIKAEYMHLIALRRVLRWNQDASAGQYDALIDELLDIRGQMAEQGLEW